MGLKFLSPNSKTISVLVKPSNGTTAAAYTFPTQQDLQNRKIIAIESFCFDDIQFDPNNSGVTVLPLQLFKNCVLSVYNSAVLNPNMAAKKQQAGLFYDKLPLVKLRTMNNYTSNTDVSSNSNDVYIIRPTEINWNKTEIEFNTPIAINTTFAAVFVVHYLDLGDNGDWWLKAMGFEGAGKKVSGDLDD